MTTKRQSKTVLANIEEMRTLVTAARSARSRVLAGSAKAPDYVALGAAIDNLMTRAHIVRCMLPKRRKTS